MKKQTGAIVILGGMGPEASAKMLQVVVDMAAEKFNAKKSDDFPEIIVDSIPIPDFISNTNKLKTARKMLKKRVRKLEALKPSFFAVACNTAHILLPDLQKVSKTPFVSILQEVPNEVAKKSLTKVGIMATPVTINSLMFQNALKAKNIDSVTPDIKQQKSLGRVIRKVIAKTSNSQDIKTISKIASALTDQGAQAILLACTELPLIFPKTFKVTVFDSIEILSNALLCRFFQTTSKNEKINNF